MTAPLSDVAGTTAGPVETWRVEGTYPTDGRAIYTLTFLILKFTPYKPDGVRQMKAKGRWQEAGEYGGWANCIPPTGPWILAGRMVPDALILACAAPELAVALQAMVDLWQGLPDGDTPARHRAPAALAAARAALSRTTSRLTTSGDPT